jgi:hypothetical protein
MPEDQYVKVEMCKLHRELLDTKVQSCDRRIDGIMNEIVAVRALQENIYKAVILVAIGVGFTLLGVVMGRGIDFGVIFQ